MYLCGVSGAAPWVATCTARLAPGPTPEARIGGSFITAFITDNSEAGVAWGGYWWRGREGPKFGGSQTPQLRLRDPPGLSTVGPSAVGVGFLLRAALGPRWGFGCLYRTPLGRLFLQHPQPGVVGVGVARWL